MLEFPRLLRLLPTCQRGLAGVDAWGLAPLARALPQLADRPGCSLGGLGRTTPLRTPPSLTHRYVQQRASRGRRPGSHNALVSAALGRLSTRQLPRRTGSHNALTGAAQPLTPIGTHSGILSSSAPLRLLRPRFGAQQPLSRGLGPAEIGTQALPEA